MTYTLDWLKRKYDQGDPLKYIFFWGHSNSSLGDLGKFIFSQWYPSPFAVDGKLYQTAEHWMMANKAKLFGDDEIFEKILRVEKPGEVKDLGRRIKGFDEAKWNAHKVEIVRQGNIHKFSQNVQLKTFLINTGDRIIVEASPTDIIWGIGLTQDAPEVENPYTWRGENLLGFAIMEARDFLR
jgi:ribA/ribD-fused uncharacterized protein